MSAWRRHPCGECAVLQLPAEHQDPGVRFGQPSATDNRSTICFPWLAHCIVLIETEDGGTLFVGRIRVVELDNLLPISDFNSSIPLDAYTSAR